MIRIEPGKRQMVRLTRAVPVEPGVERAYRVVVDEVPTPLSSQPSGSESPSVGVRFQFRYSIPLFVHGEGSLPEAKTSRRRAAAGGVRPDLEWRIISHDGQAHLEIRNAGPVHARLTEVRLRQGSTLANLAKGLFGYVLAGTSIRRPLPAGFDAGADLMATVNDSPQTLAFAAPN
jgi:fimbrial chaperone protein